MSERWIKLHTKFTEWEWYTDPVTKVVFLHLLLKANWKPTRWKGIEVGVGQLVIGRKALAEELRLSEQNVRTALDHLKATGEITIKPTNRYSLVTIENWAKYQGCGEEVTNNQPTTNQQIPNNQPTTNQPQPLKTAGLRDCEESNQPATNQQGSRELTTPLEDRYKYKEKSISNDIDKKKPYGEFGNVLLTDVEYQKLINYTGSEQTAKELIERLSGYMASEGKRYKSHYATMQNWFRKDKDELSRSTGTKEKESGTRKGTAIPKKWLEDLERYN